MGNGGARSAGSGWVRVRGGWPIPVVGALSSWTSNTVVGLPVVVAVPVDWHAAKDTPLVMQRLGLILVAH